MGRGVRVAGGGAGGTSADTALDKALQPGLVLLLAPRQPADVGQQRLRVEVVGARSLQALQGQAHRGFLAWEGGNRAVRSQPRGTDIAAPRLGPLPSETSYTQLRPRAVWPDTSRPWCWAGPLSQRLLPSRGCPHRWGHPQLQQRSRDVSRQRELIRYTTLQKGQQEVALPVPPAQGCARDNPPPRPPTPPRAHLQGVVEKLAHAAEASRLQLLPLQPVQGICDVLFLDGHVGSGLPEGLEDKRRQPESQRAVRGVGTQGLSGEGVCLVAGGDGWSLEGCHRTAPCHAVPYQVLPLSSRSPKAL